MSLTAVAFIDHELMSPALQRAVEKNLIKTQPPVRFLLNDPDACSMTTLNGH